MEAGERPEVCTDPRGPAENPDLLSRFFREQMTGVHDLLRQDPPPPPVHTVGMELNLSSLPDNAIHVCGFGGEDGCCMWCPKLILCSAAAHLSRYSRRIRCWCSFKLVSIEQPVCPM
jgi:hypothetical protein